MSTALTGGSDHTGAVARVEERCQLDPVRRELVKLLERLTPVGRAAFLLREVFDDDVRIADGGDR